MEYGARGANLLEWLIFEEEYYRAGAPGRVNQNGIFLLAPTLIELGTEAQKERILKPMASADYLWAQAWSEPEAGSDLAAVKSRAERDEEAGGWRETRRRSRRARHGRTGVFSADELRDRGRGAGERRRKGYQRAQAPVLIRKETP